jgi:hypothetical protein
MLSVRRLTIFALVALSAFLLSLKSLRRSIWQAPGIRTHTTRSDSIRYAGDLHRDQRR